MSRTKVCLHCRNRFEDRSRFHNRKSCTECKPIVEMKQKTLYNKEYYEKYTKPYRIKNRDKVLAQRKSYYRSGGKDLSLRRIFGMEIGEYSRLLELQEGCCAICGNKPTSRALAVDHDHITGNVRGLLCNNCNVLLGCAKDNASILLKCVGYLNKTSTIPELIDDLEDSLEEESE